MAPLNSGRGPDLSIEGPETIKRLRRTQWGSESDRTVNVKGANEAGTIFGVLDVGTPLGKIATGAHAGYYRPAGKGVIDGAQAGVNEIEMGAGQVDNFFVGDVVDVYRPSTGATIVDGRTVEAVDKLSDPPTVTISGATVTVADGDLLILDNGAQVGKRILLEKLLTSYLNRTTGALTAKDQTPSAASHVDAENSSPLVGWNSYLAEDLPGVLTD